jgi:hypothetical protein
MQALTHSAGDPGTAVVDDQAALLSHISTLLESMPGQMAPEFELKSYLGLCNIQGHRNWRKSRAKLVTLGVLQQFTGTVEVRPVH